LTRNVVRAGDKYRRLPISTSSGQLGCPALASQRPSHLTEFGDEWTMWARNGVLNARKVHFDDAQFTVNGPKHALAGLLLRPGQTEAILAKAGPDTGGGVEVLKTFARVIDSFDPNFTQVTP
jgi:alkyl sulfatase BDS1-like metallo-beta-lactamase superfamily hydrolase